MPADKKLTKLLVEAHTNELALVKTLEAHARLAQEKRYRTLIERHLEETRSHAARIARRLDELGYMHSPIAVAYDIAQGALKQSMVLAKGPVDAIRGGRDKNEKMVKNAMDEAMTEGLEIAAYDVIESAAKAVGDDKTAALASEIRSDEERMLSDLRRLIPTLSEAFIEDRVLDTTEQESVKA